MMQQPSLAPNPHAQQQSPRETEVEQTLRESLVANLSQQQRAAGAKPQEMSNIDPAISGVGAAATQPQAQAIPTKSQQTPQPQVHQHPAVPVPQPQSPGMMAHQGDGSASDEHGDGQSSGKQRSGKRELSTSKRAAQNRAAQRAFRQRKEGYIKKLEEQVRDFTSMQESYKSIQAENFQLRDYIINLQSRLIESQGEDAVPPPPHSLIHPTPPVSLVSNVEPQAMGSAQTPVTTATTAPPPPPPPPPSSSAAPTASMGSASSVPVPVPMPVPVSEIGQKRTRDAVENSSFLQSVAAAAAAGNGFVAVHTNTQTPLGTPAAGTKSASGSASPSAKRVKGEVEKEGQTNGGA